MRFTPEAEVTEQLGLPPHVLPSMRRAGKGPRHHKFGNKAYYLQEEVEAWLATCAQDPTADAEEAADTEEADEVEEGDGDE